jgi:hypothetical protein
MENVTHVEENDIHTKLIVAGNTQDQRIVGGLNVGIRLKINKILFGYLTKLAWDTVYTDLYREVTDLAGFLMRIK